MRVALLLLLVCISLTGCRINPNAEREIALLRAEILDLEDQYYALQDQCGGQVETVSTTGFPNSSGVNGECINCDEGAIIYDNSPDVIYDQDFSAAPQSTSEPALRIEDQQPAADSEGSDSRIDSDPEIEEVLPNEPSSILDTSMNDGLQQRAESSISSVVINRRLSKGQDLNGKPGHEGLALLVQPIDNAGRVQKTPGHLTVRIMERNAHVSARQIGMWQFTPEEIESFFVKDDYAEQGILLHLPWDKMIPGGRRIDVFVRYVTPDRRTLDSNLEISIEPPDSNYSSEDPVVAEWIEQDDRWRDFEFDFPENVAESARDSSTTVNGDPAFRVKSSSSDRRNSAPRWRPVR